MADRSIALPASRQWEFGGRTFEQSELTIDGEAQLLSLAARTARTLAENGFPFERVPAVIRDDGSFDITVASGLLLEAVNYVPDVASESTVILFGVFPVDEYGKPNPTYDDTKKLIRKHLKFAVWLDIVQTFLDQNDYKRLAAPFVSGVTRTVQAVAARNETPSEDSSPPSTSS